MRGGAARAMLAAAAFVPAVAFASCEGDAMIVLDASSSMGVQARAPDTPARIDEARAALATVLPEVAPVRRLGLMVYGPGGAGSCDGVELHLSPAPDAAGEILARAGRVLPEGSTALTRAVREAASALGPGGTVVLVTDGEETCGGRPCELAVNLAAARPDVTVHVIGFRMREAQPPPGYERGGPGADALPAKMRCLADETGGVRATARTLSELSAALRRTLGCALLF